MAGGKEDTEDIRLTAECLVYVMKSVNQYPLKKYQDAAEGTGDLAKMGREIRTKLVEYYFTIEPDKWEKIANDTPKGKKLSNWISSNFITNPLSKGSDT